MDRYPDLDATLASLAADGVLEVRAAYSGYDDEGEIGAIALFRLGHPLEHLDGSDPRWPALEAAIEEGLPEQYEVGNGSRGVATLIVATRRVTATWEKLTPWDRE